MSLKDSSFIFPACGGFLHAGVELQSMSSPNYPNHYPSNAHCVWTISAMSSYHIWFNVTEIDTEYHFSCIYDFVAVYEGENCTVQ